MSEMLALRSARIAQVTFIRELQAAGVSLPESIANAEGVIDRAQAAVRACADSAARANADWREETRNATAARSAA